MKERQNLKLRASDTVRVWQKIEELKQVKGANKKEVTTKNVRKQAFEGLILAVKHGNEAGATFTVRKVASGVGVEKVFPLYSPAIDSIEIVKSSVVRRAKLYFIRRKAARDVKRQMRRVRAVAPAAAVEEDIAPAEAAQPKEIAEAIQE